MVYLKAGSGPYLGLDTPRGRVTGFFKVTNPPPCPRAPFVHGTHPRHQGMFWARLGLGMGVPPRRSGKNVYTSSQTRPDQAPWGLRQCSGGESGVSPEKTSVGGSGRPASGPGTERPPRRAVPAALHVAVRRRQCRPGQWVPDANALLLPCPRLETI